MEYCELESVIGRVEELPTLPAVITRVLEVLEDEKSSARDLEKVISCDQSITAKVLRIANSAYYGFPREITTIHRGIVLLGFQTVKALALGSSIFETFFGQNQTSSFDRTAYWLHSIACSRCAMALGRKVGGLDPDEAFLAGLIHDIGMVAMDHRLHDDYGHVLEKAIRQKGHLNQLERAVWGFDHADVGAWLCERWGFPRSLLEAVHHHHRVSESGEQADRLVAAVHLADFCSNEAGMSVTGCPDGGEPQQEALNLTGMTGLKLGRFINRIGREKDQIEAFFEAMLF